MTDNPKCKQCNGRGIVDADRDIAPGKSHSCQRCEGSGVEPDEPPVDVIGELFGDTLRGKALESRAKRGQQKPGIRVSAELDRGWAVTYRKPFEPDLHCLKVYSTKEEAEQVCLEKNSEEACKPPVGPRLHYWVQRTNDLDAISKMFAGLAQLGAQERIAEMLENEKARRKCIAEEIEKERAQRQRAVEIITRLLAQEILRLEKSGKEMPWDDIEAVQSGIEVLESLGEKG